MSDLCAKCGGPLGADKNFDPKSITSPEITFLSASKGPAAEVAPSVSSTTSQVQSAGALKIVLITLASAAGAVVLSLALAAFMGYRLLRGLSGDNTEDSISSPPALIDERQHPIAAGPSIVLSERALGVPLYPGASLQPGWSTKVSKASGLEVEAKYSTSDPASRVAAFYKRNLGSALKVILEADETTMYLGSGRNIVTMAERSTHGQTQINILHKDAKFPMAEVNEKVRQIVAQQLQVNEVEVTPNARFQEDLGADSLDLIEMVMQVEEAFDIQIADGAAEKIMTVKDAVDYIDLKWNAAKS